MRIKFVVGELRGLNRYDHRLRSKNGFYAFIIAAQWRVNEETGELDLDDEDLRKISHYSRTGYKKRLQAIFQRPLGDKFDWSA
jgi:hypothetical protein